MDKNEFIENLKKLNIAVNDDILYKLDTYYKMLISYNMHTNLTRITDEKEVYLKHFYDSLTIIKTVNLNNQTLLDIGTGAGFPGLVLKIVFPKLKVTLLDSLNKRILFLKDVIEELGLNDIGVIHARAEEYANDHREKFDIVTSRAVANLNVLSELCIPYIKVGGNFISMKSNAFDEIKSAEKSIKTLGCVIKETVIFELPKEKSKRTLINIQKVQETDVKYPRKFSEIKKKPL